MNRVKQHRINDAHVFPKDTALVIVDKKELDMLELDNDMAGGIFAELKEILVNMPCYHVDVKAPVPMFYPEHFMCIRSYAIEQTFSEIISALRAEGMDVAANVVIDKLAERKKDERKALMEEPNKDSGIQG